MLEEEYIRFLDSLRRFKTLDPLKDLLPITQRDFIVLMIIHDKKEARPSELAQILELSLPAISDMLKKQIERDLLVKGEDLQDRRSYVVQLSENGLSTYLQGKKVMDYFLKTIVERYGRENMARLLLVMDDIYQLMDKTKQEILEERDA